MVRRELKTAHARAIRAAVLLGAAAVLGAYEAAAMLVTSCAPEPPARDWSIATEVPSAAVAPTPSANGLHGKQGLIFTYVEDGDSVTAVEKHVSPGAPHFTFAPHLVVDEAPIAPELEVDPRGLLTPLVWIACAFAFLQWVVAVHRAAVACGARPAGDALQKATVGYFAPLVSLWWPYVGLRSLDRAIDPAGLPEPPARPEPGAHALGYREGARALLSRGTKTPPPPLGSWWSCWAACSLAAHYLGGISLVLSSLGLSSTGIRPLAREIAVFSAPAAVLAILVVLRMDARLAERARRLAELAARPG
jgi:hypothetical protein